MKKKKRKTGKMDTVACSNEEEPMKHKQQCCCCISHHFLKTVTQNPQKVAEIHASPLPPGAAAGMLVIPAQLTTGGYDHSPSSSLPVYDGDQCFTFANMSTSVDSLSSRLQITLHADGGDHLVKPQCEANSGKRSYKPKIVGIYMAPSVEYIVSVLSVLRCGEAFLPLDPAWPKHRIFSIVSSCNADLVIASKSSFHKGCYGISDWPCPVLFFSMEESVGSVGGNLLPLVDWPCEKEEKRLFCYLMYTSGSTGRPKGVCGTEEGLLNRFQWMQGLYPLYGEENLLFKTSISFVDHLQEFLSAMLAACTLFIPTFTELRERPFSIVNFVQAYSINRLTAIPSLMRAITPALQSQHSLQIQSSLKLLVLSGEVFPLSLWEALSSLLPNTTILNLYGTTEVSGDCTYFDCKWLPMILEKEPLKSVPIGRPISNCVVELVCEADRPHEGEICVGGHCVCNGYLLEAAVMSSHIVKLDNSFIYNCFMDGCAREAYFKTGDFARRLECGDLIFMGRRDRTVKVNGQRIALEEIENTLKGHHDLVDAAVVSQQGPPELLILKAFLLLKEKDKCGDSVRSSIKKWMVGKVPLSMIPNRFEFIESFPMSSSGKVDYALLASSSFSELNVQEKICYTKTSDVLQAIKKVFCEALMVEEVSNDDDFFIMGGNSIAAAHASYNLGIDMRLLYNFPTPSKLHSAIFYKEESQNMDVRVDSDWKLGSAKKMSYPDGSVTSKVFTPESHGWLSKKPHQEDDHAAVSKRSKVDHTSSKIVSPRDMYHWSASISSLCSFSRCNKVMHADDCGLNACQVNWLTEVSRNSKGSSMQELWKVHMESCVDASPLVVFKEQDVHLFIGSHSHIFVSVNARSGSVQWEVKLEGRIECSAAIVDDFSQVVVGCYGGKIYFLDFFRGNICWAFEISGEVKSQPIVDLSRQLIWCGSHDHNLYALDYRNHCCIYKLPCGGSIYGSPAIAEEHHKLYVASTSGRLTALSIKASPFHPEWKYELEVPVFGSLSVVSSSGNVICCLVDGRIVALDLNGSIVWKSRTGGPIFSGACMSYVLPSQVVICSRNGSVYSFEPEMGNLLWEFNVGEPITAGAYVDEHLQLIFDSSLLSDRLVCICASSGCIYLLRVNCNIEGNTHEPMVQEFTRLQLSGEIFSSPVMIGGKIFTGCRDDFVRCIAIETQSSMVQRNS